MHKKVKAFTMMEIMIVIVIVGIIALFSIPNYVKVIAKADERNVIVNLKIIRSAHQIFVNGGGTLADWNGLAVINAALRIPVIDPKSTYACAVVNNECGATHPAGWVIHFRDDHVGGLIHCDGGVGIDCPSCPFGPGNCE